MQVRINVKHHVSTASVTTNSEIIVQLKTD